MKVLINEYEIELFSGARLKDAILKYSAKDYKLILAGRKTVVDKMKNQISMDGEISDGDYFLIKTKRKKRSHE